MDKFDEQHPCDHQCQLHITLSDKVRDIETILHGKDGKDGWLIRMASHMESMSIVRMIVYSGVGIILTVFMGAVAAFVIRSPK